MSANPVTVRTTSESQSRRESAKPMSPAPSSAATMGRGRYSPRTDLRAASPSAETTEPTPAAPIRKPSVCGPPWRTSVANTGISTMYGTPMKLMAANRTSTARMGAKPVT